MSAEASEARKLSDAAQPRGADAPQAQAAVNAEGAGTRVGGAGAKAQRVDSAASAHRAPQAPQRPDPYQAEPRTKDHVAAGLLAIFFGWLGIHKFYLGYYDAGFVMLAITVVGSLLTFGVACGVVEVIAIIEGVIYFTKSQTEFENEYVFRKREWF